MAVSCVSAEYKSLPDQMDDTSPSMIEGAEDGIKDACVTAKADMMMRRVDAITREPSDGMKERKEETQASWKSSEANHIISLRVTHVRANAPSLICVRTDEITLE